MIDSIRTGKIPDGASRRKDTLGAVRSLHERHRSGLSVEGGSWLAGITAALSRTGDARPEVNDRDWDGEDVGGHFQTVQLDADVYRRLVNEQRPTERTLNDTFRRILT
ncbi:hypothetical protein NFX31_15965 [Microbacterium azadirachtae]|uniref:hypothetical protein n=1 Tax=Microbacterium azadirachtae TaxID=582680 RepID=UPI0021D4AD42|nr:hypothetical protein [Microbacterium azadirachtae]UXW85678.1 hypothetical protein NFX31_15965 [Microbacterium azadirachtae]